MPRAKLTTTGLASAAARELGGGDEPHHAALYERVLERIHGYFRRLLRDPLEAEECTQRTFLELERSLREAKYEAGRSFNTWMWMKAHTVFVAWCRERERNKRARPLGEAIEEGLPREAQWQRSHTDRTDERLDAAVVLERVAEQLGAEVYECFVLRYEGGLNLEEIALTVGRTRKTVAARITKAHALIDRVLGAREPG